MLIRQSSALLVCLLFGFGIVACSSTKTTTAKPEMSLAAPPKASAESAKKVQTSRSGSSLESFQQGQSTATPGESPLKEIYFDFDRYDLRADARAILKANADWLRANPSARVQVEGHCDERGTNEYNLALGAKRAQSAKDYLLSLGILAERVSTVSYGEELPVCKEPTEACWQKNRRDRFVIQPAAPSS
jgi:peptidoglycan-associated lipoprotein